MEGVPLLLLGRFVLICVLEETTEDDGQQQHRPATGSSPEHKASGQCGRMLPYNLHPAAALPATDSCSEHTTPHVGAEPWTNVDGRHDTASIRQQLPAIDAGQITPGTTPATEDDVRHNTASRWLWPRANEQPLAAAVAHTCPAMATTTARDSLPLPQHQPPWQKLGGGGVGGVEHLRFKQKERRTGGEEGELRAASKGRLRPRRPEEEEAFVGWFSGRQRGPPVSLQGDAEGTTRRAEVVNKQLYRD